ncbi:MAG: endonuclease III [Coriobacteriales bacterium]|jgi:endonuclease-3
MAAEKNTGKKTASKPRKRRKPSAKVAERASIVMERMAEHYPSSGGYLTSENPFQLVIAVLLSAQTTDKAVNSVTPELFRRWPTPEALAAADELEIQEVIHPLGFYKTKAKRCIECAATLLTEFGGEVPRTIDELIKLPGVGRKTANVVLNDAFGIAEGVAVDTHVGRIARKLGFSRNTDPSKVEQDILWIFPESEWTHINHRWIAFGREVCDARKPKCSECWLSDVCPSCKVR